MKVIKSLENRRILLKETARKITSQEGGFLNFHRPLMTIYESGFTALIILNKEMENIMKIVKLLEESRLLVKGISEIIKNETKEQKGKFNKKFISMLLGTLAVTILGNALEGQGVIRTGEGTIRAGENF